MEIPRHWRLKQQRYGLVGEICPHCDYKMFPPRDVCPNCNDEAKVLYSSPKPESTPPSDTPPEATIATALVTLAK